MRKLYGNKVDEYDIKINTNSDNNRWIDQERKLFDIAAIEITHEVFTIVNAMRYDIYLSKFAFNTLPRKYIDIK